MQPLPWPLILATPSRPQPSTAPMQSDLILVTLTRLPATVLEIRPGMAQLVTVGELPFIHLHAPVAETPTFFPSLRPHLDFPIAPVITGDYTPGPADPAVLP